MSNVASPADVKNAYRKAIKEGRVESSVWTGVKIPGDLPKLFCPQCKKLVETKKDWLCPYCDRPNRSKTVFHRCESCERLADLLECPHPKCGENIVFSADHDGMPIKIIQEEKKGEPADPLAWFKQGAKKVLKVMDGVSQGKTITEILDGMEGQQPQENPPQLPADQQLISVNKQEREDLAQNNNDWLKRCENNGWPLDPTHKDRLAPSKSGEYQRALNQKQRQDMVIREKYDRLRDQIRALSE